MARIEAMNAANTSRWSRPGRATSTIFPEMVGHTIAVHDGRKHVPVFVSRVDGRPQARRVRADAHLPRPRRHREGPIAMTRRRPTRRPPRSDGAETEAADEAEPLEATPRRRAARPRPRRPRRASREPHEAERDAEAEEPSAAEDEPAAEAKPAEPQAHAVAEDEGRARAAEGRSRAAQAAPPSAGERAASSARSAKYVRTSARKARLVCDHIRGKSVDEARAILAHTPARGGRGLEQAARVRRRQRRAQPRAGRRRPADPSRHRRRGPDAQALPPARHGPRDAHPQAHQPPDDHAHAEGAVRRMGQKVHPESMRVGYIHDWKSNWFNERDFADYLAEDVAHPRATSPASSRTPACRTSRSARTPTRWRSTSTPRVRAS